MKCRWVHAGFAVVALGCAATAAVQGWRWHEALALNRAIDAAATAPIGPEPVPAPLDAPREVRFARALALARAGAYDAAFQAYGGLIPPAEPDPLARDALFNLGNTVLRQGMGTGQGAASMPLVELAKQRYRDLLRAAPDDWDARYNLERALRVAPETEPVAEDTNVPAEQRRVMMRGMKAGDLP